MKPYQYWTSLVACLCLPSITMSQTLVETKSKGSIAASTELPVAKPEDVGMSAMKLSLVIPTLKSLVEDEKIPHAIVAVARRGKVVLFDSVGWSNIKEDKKIANDSILRFYSMTKPFTSVAVMMLVEDGKIDLDEDVSKYIPEFANLKVYAEDGNVDARRAMTVRDLLRHTSGLTYGLFSNTPVDEKYRAAGVLSPADTLQVMVEKLGKLPLLHHPGTKFNYSVSTDVLGHVVERVSGRSLDDFFQQEIFEPLDMKDTSFQVPATKVDRFANNYSPTRNGLRSIDGPPESPFLNEPKAFSGGGGTMSTARDYLRFCQMLLNKGELNGRRLLKPSTVEEMTKNQLPKEAYPVSLGGRRDGVGFGLGFSVVVEMTDYTRITHVGEFGWGGAASTHFWISPKDELSVVVLTQHMPFSMQLEAAVKPLVYDALLD